MDRLHSNYILCYLKGQGDKDKELRPISFDDKFKEVEGLFINRLVRLDDLSEKAYKLFKTWIERS